MAYMDSSGIPGRSREELKKLREGRKKAAKEVSSTRIPGVPDQEVASQATTRVKAGWADLPPLTQPKSKEATEVTKEPEETKEPEADTEVSGPEAGASGPETPAMAEQEFGGPSQPESKAGQHDTDEVSDEKPGQSDEIPPVFAGLQTLAQEPQGFGAETFTPRPATELAPASEVAALTSLDEFMAKQTTVLTEAKPTTSELSAEIKLEKPVKSMVELQADAERELYSYENAGKLQRKASLAGYGCLKCRYTGWVVALGEAVPCSCQSKAASTSVKSGPTVIDPEKIIASGDTAVARGIIPANRADDDFDIELARMNISAYTTTCMGQMVYGLDKYIEVLGKILVAIANNTLNSSFVIGAPKRSGKTTFVMTCLKRLVNAQKNVVPYMSLTELAELQKDHLRVVGLRERAVKPAEPKGAIKFNWKDVLNADVLFTYLTNFESASVELSVLKNLLAERGMRGRPTIVMTENSVAQYKKNAKLNNLYWNDIECFDRDEITTKKLIHVSIWRKLMPYQGDK